jgi:hypothetical protein
MHKSEKIATRYAQTLADMHQETRHVVKLPYASRDHRRRNHLGDYYGGVRPEELASFLTEGATLLATVEPEQKLPLGIPGN